jgi:YidC/Oxa1 family membrane protein insertase
LWWAVFGIPISTGLTWLYQLMNGVPLLSAIGAYGIALILVTLIIKLVLAPLFEYQIRSSKKNLENQRKMAPQMAEIRKKYKGDPQKQQAATMELYREHGVNPLGQMSGCLPSLFQFPILAALYWVFYGNAQHHLINPDHFLFIPHLNTSPMSNPLVAGVPIPGPLYLVIPILAGASTFIQSRMMQQAPNPAATEQEQQTQQMMKSMQVMMPLMVLYFAVITPAGLGLYWLVSNCFAIIQQYRVNGWGGLRPQPQAAAAAVPAAPVQARPTPIPAKRKSPAKRTTPAKRTRKSTR